MTDPVCGMEVDPSSAKGGSGSRFAAFSLSSAYFSSDPLKRNSKNASSALTAGVTLPSNR